MSRVLLLVGASGATLGETRIDDDDRRSLAEDRLREEAAVSGFSEEEIRSARFVMAGDPPNQP